jgi:acyl dehydratase
MIEIPQPLPCYHFADMPMLEGKRFRLPPFVIEASEVRAFESVTWIDRVYTDPDPPEFPQDIIEGFHSLSLLDAVHKMAYRVDPAECYAFNYGLNLVRFPSPMFIGDRIVPTLEVRSVRRRGNGFLVVLACELQVEGAAKPGLVADWVVLTLPRKGFELDDEDGRP